MEFETQMFSLSPKAMGAFLFILIARLQGFCPASAIRTLHVGRYACKNESNMTLQH